MASPTRFPTPAISFQGGRSLFWKVLALVLITALIATTAIGFYVRYIFRDVYEEFLTQQIASYVEIISEQLGSPADTAAARLIARRHPLDIRIERHGHTWATDSTVASAETILTEGSRTSFDRDSIRFLTYDSHLNAVMPTRSETYVIRMRSEPELNAHVLLPTALLILILVLLLTAAYLYVHHFLRPVAELRSGVRIVGQGDFSYRVPVSSNDELGELAQAFNAMSEQIAAIIASKRRLLFDVSHELRSPLTRMNVALAMLPEGKAKLSMERNIRELNIMITELLENERLAVLGSKLVVEEIDVVKLVRSIIETFGHDAHRIEFDTLTDALEIIADNQRLQVAVRNVISNALKYSSESDAPVRVSVFPDDEGARIVVSDHGIGIPPEAQDKVFEVFYRTDDSRSRETGGYGLGLSLTKSIVEAHDGAITLTSRLNEGTTVSMWLPKNPAPESVVRNVKSLQGA